MSLDDFRKKLDDFRWFNNILHDFILFNDFR